MHWVSESSWNSPGKALGKRGCEQSFHSAFVQDEREEIVGWRAQGNKQRFREKSADCLLNPVRLPNGPSLSTMCTSVNAETPTAQVKCMNRDRSTVQGGFFQHVFKTHLALSAWNFPGHLRGQNQKHFSDSYSMWLLCRSATVHETKRREQDSNWRCCFQSCHLHTVLHTQTSSYRRFQSY